MIQHRDRVVAYSTGIECGDMLHRDRVWWRICKMWSYCKHIFYGDGGVVIILFPVCLQQEKVRWKIHWQIFKRIFSSCHWKKERKKKYVLVLSPFSHWRHANHCQSHQPVHMKSAVNEGHVAREKTVILHWRLRLTSLVHISPFTMESRHYTLHSSVTTLKLMTGVHLKFKSYALRQLEFESWW